MKRNELRQVNPLPQKGPVMISLKTNGNKVIDINNYRHNPKEKTSLSNNWVSDIIQPQQCTEDSIEIKDPLDFALTFWMVHETPDIENFLTQIHAALKPNGLLLITEPKFHVSLIQLAQEIDLAKKVGFTIKDRPKITFCHSVMLRKGNDI